MLALIVIAAVLLIGLAFAYAPSPRGPSPFEDTDPLIPPAASLSPLARGIIASLEREMAEWSVDLEASSVMSDTVVHTNGTRICWGFTWHDLQERATWSHLQVYPTKTFYGSAEPLTDTDKRAIHETVDRLILAPRRLAEKVRRDEENRVGREAADKAAIPVRAHFLSLADGQSPHS